MTRLARALWFAGGWCAVAVGSIGIVVPGLPTTVFFIIAAACFSRSSPRLEAWVLGLPRIGPVVRDHRAGLGLPHRAKVWALAMMWTAISISGVLLRDRLALVAVIGVLGLIGTVYILWRVPWRERVLADRAAASFATPACLPPSLITAGVEWTEAVIPVKMSDEVADRGIV